MNPGPGGANCIDAVFCHSENPGPVVPEYTNCMRSCGTDKGHNGYCRDTIHFCNALIDKNVHTKWAWYKDADADALYERFKDFDGLVPRINPALDGQYEGVTDAAFLCLHPDIQGCQDEGVCEMPLRFRGCSSVV